MITILHGDHVEASRAELVRIISSAKDKEIRRLDGKTLDQAALIQAMQSSSLFVGNTPLVVIERLFAGKNKKSKEFGAVIDILNKSADQCETVLWEDKELDATTLKSLGNVQNRLFKIPPKIFQLLDNLKPQNAKQLLTAYQTLSDSVPAELAFAMVVRRVRQLLAVAGGAKPTGLAGWQEARLTKQASLFTMEQLIAMHAQLLAAEYSLKTGVSPYQLSERIEQFLIVL